MRNAAEGFLKKSDIMLSYVTWGLTPVSLKGRDLPKYENDPPLMFRVLSSWKHYFLSSKVWYFFGGIIFEIILEDTKTKLVEMMC